VSLLATSRPRVFLPRPLPRNACRPDAATIGQHRCAPWSLWLLVSVTAVNECTAARAGEEDANDVEKNKNVLEKMLKQFLKMLAYHFCKEC
jgi:hypothetical protein